MSCTDEQAGASRSVPVNPAGPGNQRPEHVDKCLEIALANRSFEIDLLWKRTLVFWGFVAILFVAVAQAAVKSRPLAIVLACLGIVFSLIWTLVNRGSKSWQESWEIKSANFFQERYDYRDLFRRATSPQTDIVWLLRSRPYSLSRLLTALSDFVLLFWLGLLLYLLPIELVCLDISGLKRYSGIFFVAFTLAYSVYVLVCCRSRTGDASGALP